MAVEVFSRAEQARAALHLWWEVARMWRLGHQ